MKMRGMEKIKGIHTADYCELKRTCQYRMAKFRNVAKNRTKLHSFTVFGSIFSNIYTFHLMKTTVPKSDYWCIMAVCA